MAAPQRFKAAEVEREQAQLDAAEEELAGLGGAGDAEAAGRRRWQETFEATPEFAPERHNLLGGTVLPWWGRIQEAGLPVIYAAQDDETGERIVGVEVPPPRASVRWWTRSGADRARSRRARSGATCWTTARRTSWRTASGSRAGASGGTRSSRSIPATTRSGSPNSASATSAG